LAILVIDLERLPRAPSEALRSDRDGARDAHRVAWPPSRRHDEEPQIGFPPLPFFLPSFVEPVGVLVVLAHLTHCVYRSADVEARAASDRTLPSSRSLYPTLSHGPRHVPSRPLGPHRRTWISTLRSLPLSGSPSALEHRIAGEHPGPRCARVNRRSSTPGGCARFRRPEIAPRSRRCDHKCLESFNTRRSRTSRRSSRAGAAALIGSAGPPHSTKSVNPIE